MASTLPRPQAHYSQAADAAMSLMRNDRTFAAKFAEWMRDNQGKPPEQIAREAGIDYRIIRRMLGQ